MTQIFQFFVHFNSFFELLSGVMAINAHKLLKASAKNILNKYKFDVYTNTSLLHSQSSSAGPWPTG